MSAAQPPSRVALSHRLNALPALNDLKLSGAQRAVRSRGEACFRRVRSGEDVRFECRMRQSRASSLCNVRVHAVPLLRLSSYFNVYDVWTLYGRARATVYV